MHSQKHTKDRGWIVAPRRVRRKSGVGTLSPCQMGQPRGHFRGMKSEVGILASRPSAGKPRHQRSTEFVERRIATAVEPSRVGNLAKDPGRTPGFGSHPRVRHRLLHRSLGVAGLVLTAWPMPLVYQPRAQRRVIARPTDLPGCGLEVAPYPRFELRLDDDDLGSTVPTVAGEIAFDRSLDVFARIATAASVPIEDHHAIAKPIEVRAQIRCGSSSASPVSLGMHLDVEIQSTSRNSVAPSQHAAHDFPHVRVRNQDKQVLRAWLIGHPITPLANNNPLSIPPCHSLSMGWSLPLTISVAPSSFFAKQRISSGDANDKKKGECVATNT